MELGYFDTAYEDLKKCIELNPTDDRANAFM